MRWPTRSRSMIEWRGTHREMKSSSKLHRLRWLVMCSLACACSPALQGSSQSIEGSHTSGPHTERESSRSSDAYGSQCSGPVGSSCNPIAIVTFPFRHNGDTANATETHYDSYGCSPGTDERGPEIHYRIELPSPSLLRATIEESDGVDVDLHLLRSGDPDDCLERANTELEWPLAAGTHRLVVDTYFDDHPRSGAYTLHVELETPAPRRLGTMWNTYYILANEADHEGPQDVPIYDSSCQEIARVRADFHDDLCIEGSGLLLDRRMVHVNGSCTESCPSARRCGSRSYRICYHFIDATIYPYAMGAHMVALVPDLSIAVDRDFVPLGSVIYLEELDGVVPPGAISPHDGCLRADDVGGAIEGNHFDFFAGTRQRWLAWEALLPTRSEFTAWIDHPRCYGRYERGWP